LLNMLNAERASLLKMLAANAAIQRLDGSTAPAKQTCKLSAAARARISATPKKQWAKVKK
jgi:hypothetical protein